MTGTTEDQNLEAGWEKQVTIWIFTTVAPEDAHDL